MRLAPTLLLLAALCPGPLCAAEAVPDAVWDASAAPGQPPAGWVWTKADSPHAAVSFADDALVIATEPGRWGWVQRNLVGQTGTDDQPLAVSCGLAASGTGAVAHLPALLVLRWGEKDLIAVGITDNAKRAGEVATTWAGWCVDGKRGESAGGIEPYQRDSLTQVRLLVLSKVVLAQASRDGAEWRTIANVPRSGALGMPPTAIALGHGWLLPGATDGKLQGGPAEYKTKKDKEGNPVVGRYRFTGLRAARIGADLPASLTRTYQRKDSGDDTRDTLYDATFPAAWRIAGPFAPGKDPISEKGIGAAGVEWKTVASSGKASDRILQLDDLLPGGGSGTTRYAAFTITADQPRLERFLFDGLREAWLSVNGQHIVVSKSQDERQVSFDRIGAVAWLAAGENTVLLRIVSGGGKSEARLVLRHEPGDPRYRAAIGKRLLADFPPDPAQMATERTEIARAWEAAGNPKAAAEAYAEAAAVEDAPTDAVIAALTARARVHAEMRDDAAQAADVAALGKAWTSDGADAVSTALRSARLHTLLGRDDLAVKTLDQALAAGITPEERLSLSAERMRLYRVLGQDDKVVADLVALAKALPLDDLRAVPLLVTAARTAARPAAPDAPPAVPDLTAAKAAAIAGKRPADLHLAILAAQAAGDQAGVRTLGKALAGACLDGDPLLIAAAEASGDELVAVPALRRHLAALGAPLADKSSLAEARLRTLRARLAATPEGKRLLADVDGLKIQPGASVSAGNQRTWNVVGPLSNENFKRYDKPPIDPGNPDIGKPVEDRPWKELTTDANGAIDINATGLGADNSVVVMTCVVDAGAAGESVLSCGADDGLTVWCNGEKVFEDRIQRGCTPDSLKVPLKLRAGANRLTVMVQNGGGGFGFQGRMRDAPYPAIDVAKLLAAMALPANQDKRGDIAASFTALVGELNSEGRPEAGPLAVALLESFPDQPLRTIEAALSVFYACDGRPVAPYAALPACVDWLARSRIAGCLPERREFWRDIPFAAGERLRRMGEFGEALRLLQLALLTDPDPYAQARNQLQLAALYRFAGAGRAAVPLLARVADDPALGPDDARWAREQLSVLRRVKGDLLRFEAPFEAGNAARAVDRLAAAGDIEGLVPAAQKLIEGYADLALPGAGGIGTSGWRIAVDALNAAGAPALEAYRAKHQTRAEGALRSAAQTSDTAACERVALRYPLCTTRGPALLRAAELYRDQGDAALARATAATAIPDLADPALLARAKALAAWKPAVPPASAAPAVAALRATFTVAPGDAADLARIANRHTSSIPALADGVLVLHHGDDAWGIDAAGGGLRWRLPGTPAAGEAFAGMPTWETGADGAVAAVRLRGADRRLAIVRVDPATGAALWTSADRPELAGLAAVSSPSVTRGRVYAAFGDAEGARRLAAFDAADGRLLWLTSTPGRTTALPVLGDLPLAVSGHGAPPLAIGREVYWCTDAGTVVRVDAGSGALLWASAYPRAVIDPTEGRATLVAVAGRDASRVLAAGDTVVVAPRDTLGVLAFDRATGVLRWSRPLSEVRSLAGITSGAKPLVIAQGTGIEAFDPATGTTAWQVPGTPTNGTALVEPGAVFASTDAGVLRLDPATGKVLAKVPWAEAKPEERSTGTLVRVGKSVIAMGRGSLATVGAAAAKPLAIAPVGGAPLMSSGLAIQDGGPALGLAFRWAAGPVRGIIDPKAGGERYVRTDAWLARIDGDAQPKLAWQVPIDGEAKAWGFTRSCVIGVQAGAVSFYDRATGVRRATVASAPSPDMAFGSDYAVTACDEAVLCHKWGWSYVDVLDPDTGAKIMRHDFGRSVSAATVRDGKLLTIRDGDGGAWLDERDARTGAGSTAKRLPFDNIWDLKVMRAGADRWWLGRHEKTAILDLRTREVKEAENKWNWNAQWPVGSEVVGERFGIYRQDWGRGFSQVYGADGKIIYSHDHHRVMPAFFADRAVVQLVEKGDFSLAAFEYGSGKELWRWNGVGKEWERAAKALLPLGDRTVLIDQRRDGILRWNMVGADGKPTADGLLPGQPGGDFAGLSVGGTLWIGTSTGLAVLAPCAKDALKATAAGDDVPVSERTLRDFNLRGIGPALEAEGGTVAIDGDLSEWPAEPLRAAIPGDHRPPAVPGIARLGKVTLRSTFDQERIAFAVDVEERTGSQVTLRLGFDSRPDDGQRPPTPVIEVASRNGSTTLRLIGGAWPKGGDAGDLEPTARAIRGLDGWRFEIGIPWPLLRERPEWRPGDRRTMRVGLLADAPGDTVEFGHGLALGQDWTLWPPLQLVDPKKRKK